MCGNGQEHHKTLFCTALCSRTVSILRRRTPNVSLHCGFNFGAVAFHDQMCYQRGVSIVDSNSELPRSAKHVDRRINLGAHLASII